MIREFLGIKPEIDESSYIHETAEVIGKVKIGKDVSVWCQAVIRGDVEEIIIGEETNLQDGVLVHTDHGFPTVLGNGITVGHGVVLHGCKIGNNCLIGMGAIILSGAEIGENSIIGAGSVITQNKKIPEGSLVVGVPAKFKKKLSSEEIQKIKEASQHYIEKIKEYKNK